MDNLLKLTLEKYAKQNGLLMKQVASKLGMAESTLSNKLSGARSLTFEEAHLIAQLLDTSLDVVWLLVS